MTDEHDDDLYALVRTEFAPVRLRDDLDAVTTRGRALRRRRAGLTAGLAAAAVASGLLLTVPAEPPVVMQPAASSVVAEPDGTVVLTVRELTDAARLTAGLAEAGVPALVEVKRVGPAQKVVGCAEDQPSSPLLYHVMPPGGRPGAGGERVFPIRRALMPAGTSLHFVIFEQRSDTGALSRSVHTGLVEGRPRPCRML